MNNTPVYGCDGCRGTLGSAGCPTHGPTNVRLASLTASAAPPVPIVDQPPPVPNDGPGIWSLVIADMQARDKTGFERYGTRLQAFNGRDALVDAYQEALDLVVYLRQAIAERDG